MALHAAAVEILIEKGRFEPEVALGIAEAIEASIMHAQLVTVPILDARLLSLETKMEAIKAELVRWVFLVMLGNVALSAGASALLNALRHLG